MKTFHLFFSLAITLLSSTVFAQKKGFFTDPRDGKTYQTVQIGNQIWMAENLAYKTKKGCWIYGWDADNKKVNLKKYGYLYEWEAAKKACPEGWHLPTMDEWQTLFKTLGGKEVAGTKMKSTSGWSETDNGTNASGFTALPGGYRVDNGEFDAMGTAAYWWTATESDKWTVWTWSVFENDAYISELTYGKTAGGALSVRCIKD